ncbi:MAG: hypothetical protein M1318_00395, partial [Firmicutes bacterium]|nr:hypothetical protein [Bacillota bacterium]
SLQFHPAAPGLQILSALPGQPSVSAEITTLKSSSGTVLNTTASSSGSATVRRHIETTFMFASGVLMM